MNRSDTALAARRGCLRAMAAAPLAAMLAPGLLGLPGRARAADAPLPGDSLYQLEVPLVDQRGQPLRLASLRGEPVVASMFYASCDMVCPLIFETIAMTLADAGPAVQARARVLLVSFDPERDTVAVLQQMAEDHHAGPRWTIARGPDEVVRQVAAVLGVQYRRLEGGAFNHSSTISLLDAQGRVVERSARLGAVDPVLRDGLKRLVG